MKVSQRYFHRLVVANSPMRNWIITETIRRSVTASYQRCETVLLSYPRSGNHLLRYLLEASFNRPTLGAFDHERFVVPRGIHDLPIFLKVDSLRIHNRQPVAVKRHSLRPGDRFSEIVFLVRDPVEAILSHWRHIPDELFAYKVLREVRRFITNIKAFHSFSENRRFLVHYEELLASPLPATALVPFLGGGEKETQRFIAAWNEREKALGSLSRPAQAGTTLTSAGFPERRLLVLSFLEPFVDLLHSVSLSSVGKPVPVNDSQGR